MQGKGGTCRELEQSLNSSVDYSEKSNNPPMDKLRDSRTFLAIAEHGTSGSSSEDVDLQRIDARGFAYFLDSPFGRKIAGTASKIAATIARQPA